jgi:hypothetical protein
MRSAHLEPDVHALAVHDVAVERSRRRRGLLRRRHRHKGETAARARRVLPDDLALRDVPIVAKERLQRCIVQRKGQVADVELARGVRRRCLRRRVRPRRRRCTLRGVGLLQQRAQSRTLRRRRRGPTKSNLLPFPCGRSVNTIADVGTVRVGDLVSRGGELKCMPVNHTILQVHCVACLIPACERAYNRPKIVEDCLQFGGNRRVTYSVYT